MGTIKVSILEKDGVEYGSNTEMDLKDAINHVGPVAEYATDPTTIQGNTWVLKKPKCQPVGLLLALTTVNRYYFSYKTVDGLIKRMKLE